jgi:hypothetical protein
MQPLEGGYFSADMDKIAVGTVNGSVPIQPHAFSRKECTVPLR